MKIYVVCDLEGVAGVIDHRQQCAWDLAKDWFGRYYEQARRLATLELNALVEGALEGGATEVVAWDGHGNFPGGLDVELLHPACKLVMGAGDGGPEGLDNSFAALFQCGLHAMAGTEKAVLAHSFWGAIAGYWVNGQPVGEIWMNCYTAGRYGVPCVFLSGDRAAADEARALVPDIEVAVVKEALLPQAGGLSVVPAISLAPAAARQVIYASARRAMAKVGQIASYQVAPPYKLRVQFTQAEYADRVAGRPGAARTDAMTVEMEGAEQPWLLI
ncbi:MAG: M55 family metallopeptidase [Anaerolineae bacterium]|nr:M55 family metallopeptidase [Anaerolineae bacterium]